MNFKGYEIPGQHQELGRMLQRTVIEYSQRFKQTNHHLDYFLASRAAPDLLMLNTFPRKNAAKEITESMACLEALFKIRSERGTLDDKDTIVYVIGDGRKPRTGLCLAFFTRLRVVSIDPIMDMCYIQHLQEKGIQRLHCIAKKIEDVTSVFDYKGDWHSERAVCIFPHSHASIRHSLEKMTRHKHVDVVSLPCCKEDDLECEPTRSYVDHGVHSVKNVVNIYENL